MDRNPPRGHGGDFGGRICDRKRPPQIVGAFSWGGSSGVAELHIGASFFAICDDGAEFGSLEQADGMAHLAGLVKHRSPYGRGSRELTSASARGGDYDQPDVLCMRLDRGGDRPSPDPHHLHAGWRTADYRRRHYFGKLRPIGSASYEAGKQPRSFLTILLWKKSSENL